MNYKFVIQFHGNDVEFHSQTPKLVLLSEPPEYIGQKIKKTVFEIIDGAQIKTGEYECEATVIDILGFDPYGKNT